MQGTTRYCYKLNILAVGLMVTEQIFFLSFSHYKSMGALCCHGNQSSNLVSQKKKKKLVQTSHPPPPLPDDALHEM